MRIKAVVDERFSDYRKSSMFIGTISCNGKCCTEAGLPMSVCQNDGWRSCAPIEIENNDLCRRYLGNPITSAVIFGGLEPFEQFTELLILISMLRFKYECDDDVVIYTGYNKDELDIEIEALSEFPNIIVKFGRYIPGQPAHYDDVLGVNLASDNQYAERIS